MVMSRPRLVGWMITRLAGRVIVVCMVVVASVIVFQKVRINVQLDIQIEAAQVKHLA